MGPNIPGDTSEGYCAVRLDNGRIMIMSSTRGIWHFSLSPNITATDPTKLKDDNQYQIIIMITFCVRTTERLVSMCLIQTKI